MRIVPAIIPTSLEHLETTFTAITPFTREIQIDIVDGKFVPFISWPYVEGASLVALAPYVSGLEIEVDLMIVNPEEFIEAYLTLGVASVVIHLESTEYLARILELKSKYDFKLGFSIGNDTDVTVLTSVIHDADYVQLMGIAEIGSQGQAFDERVLSRIVALKNQYPALSISIDGSVNADTLPRLKEAGADRCVAGSAIMGATSPAEAYKHLLSLV